MNRALAFVVSLVLAAAGALKWLQWLEDPEGNSSDAAYWIDPAVAAVNLCLAAWLSLDVRAGAARVAAIGCFGIFAIVSLEKAVAGELSCGCFGRVIVSPWFTFAFDLAAMVALVYVAAKSDRTAPQNAMSPSKLALSISTLALVVCAVTAIDAFLPPISSVAVLEPQDWIGERFPLLEHVDIGSNLRAGTWTVLLVRDGCSECREAITRSQRRFRADAVAQAGRRLAIINMNSLAKTPEHLMSGSAFGRIKGDRLWLVETPLEITIEDGIVMALAAGANAVP